MINAPFQATSGRTQRTSGFFHNSEAGKLLHSIDWSVTPLGPQNKWPVSLQTCIQIMLSSYQPVFIWWGEKGINLYNDACIPLLGDKHPTAMGQTVAALWKDIRPELQLKIRELKNNYSTPQTAPILQLVHKDCGYQFYASVVPGTPDESGIMCFGSPWDQPDIYKEISNVHVLVESAEVQESRLAAIVECSDDAIISKDLNGIVTSWNPSAEQLFGYTAAEMIGTSITRIIPAESLDEETNIIAQITAGKKVDHFQTKRLTKTGRYVDISLTISPVKDLNGNIVGASKIARDVTEQHQLFLALQESESKYMQLAFRLEGMVEQRTRELQEANKYLEKSNQELEQFAYVTSHDLQEPLRKIHTFASMLCNVNKEQLSDSSKMYLEKVMQSTRRMSQLINELLDYSRLAHVRDPFVETNLNEILNNVLTDYEVTISQHAVIIETENLPVVQASPLQMNQLFHNLIGNALKFLSPDRQPSVKITSRQLKKEELITFPDLDTNQIYHLISITDNGIGFDQVYAEKIFQIFQRLNDRSVYEGTGIGLALCRQIALNHKGIIYANSIVNEGASFHVVLPAI